MPDIAPHTHEDELPSGAEYDTVGQVPPAPPAAGPEVDEVVTSPMSTSGTPRKSPPADAPPHTRSGAPQKDRQHAQSGEPEQQSQVSNSSRDIGTVTTPEETPTDVSAASFPVPVDEAGIPPRVDDVSPSVALPGDQAPPLIAAPADEATTGRTDPTAVTTALRATIEGEKGRPVPTAVGPHSPTGRQLGMQSEASAPAVNTDNVELASIGHPLDTRSEPSALSPLAQRSSNAASPPASGITSDAEQQLITSDDKTATLQPISPPASPADPPVPSVSTPPIQETPIGAPEGVRLEESPLGTGAEALNTVCTPALSPSPETTSEISATAETAAMAVGELPELSCALDEPPLPGALKPGDVLGPEDGECFRVVAEYGVSFGCRRYTAEHVTDGTRVWLDEASTPEGQTHLQRQADILTSVEPSSNKRSFFPRVLSTFSEHGRSYVVTTTVVSDTPTLADVLATVPPSFLHTLTLITQVASALRQMHARGAVHLGIRPDIIEITRPVTIADMAYALPIGMPLPQSYAHPGYSAPELVAGHPADVRADIYSVGALLYTAATGQALPETGAPLTLFFPRTPRPGVPQILTRCLGRPETRYASMDELHGALLRLAFRETPPVRHAIAGRTEIGLEPGRTTNQDAIASLSGTLISEAATEQWSVIVVADGMGGMAAGDVASDIAVHAVLKEAATQFSTHPLPTPDEQVQWVREWTHAANEQVCAAMEKRQARGGCTLVCACVIGQRLTIAHVGDCRLYLIRKEHTRLLTRDHSLAMALVLQGEATLNEIRGHPKRSQVTRSLGERHPLQEYQIDTLQQMTMTPTLELAPGDILLLCSDGLWELVEDKELGATVKEHHNDLNRAASTLIDLSMDRGGPDNSTALLLRIDRSRPDEQG